MNVSEDPCPKCGGELAQTDKNTVTGKVWREFTCRSCGHIVDVEEGVAMWQVLHDDAEARRQENARVKTLVDAKVDVKLKLAALWASTMACYIYCDYFELYTPGKIDAVAQGTLGPLGAVTQGILLGTSLLMAVPSLMIFLSVALPARPNRFLNLVVGAFYALLLALLAVSSHWYFYSLFAAIEAMLSALVVWHAWHWPEER